MFRGCRILAKRIRFFAAENNRSNMDTKDIEETLMLDERVDWWMVGISDRVKVMEEKCRETMDTLPEIPDDLEQGGYSEEEVEAGLEEECSRLSLWNRKGLSIEEWSAFEKEIQAARSGFWNEYVTEWDSDYDYDYLLGIIRFKLKWMAFYWDNFGHCEKGGRCSSRMKLAIRLIEIVRGHGQAQLGAASLPYVNLRNQSRFDDFKCAEDYYPQGEPQRVRFLKAWCLLWALLKENLLDWWD